MLLGFIKGNFTFAKNKYKTTWAFYCCEKYLFEIKIETYKGQYFIPESLKI
jgi:hypothetical protein